MRQRPSLSGFLPGDRVVIHQDEGDSFATVVECTGVPTINDKGFWVDVIKDYKPGELHGVQGIPSYILEKI